MKKTSLYQKINRFIFGSNPFVSLDKRIISLVLFITIIISIVGNISNIILGFDSIVIIATAITTVGLVLLYRFVKKSKSVVAAGKYFFVFALIVITALWLVTGGYDGNNISLVYLCFMICFIILPDRWKYYSAITFIILVTALITLQYFYPQLILPYNNSLQRYVDWSVGNFLYLLLELLFLNILFQNFSFEKKRIALKNAILDKLNNKLDEKNKEIEAQNILLRESEERYYSIFNNSPNIMFIHQDTKFLIMNEPGLRFLHKTQDEVINRSIFDYIPEDQQVSIYDKIRNRKPEISSEPYEAHLYGPDNKKHTFLVSSLAFEYKGRIANLVTLTDITERKIQEDRKEKRLHFENALMDFSTKLLLNTNTESNTLRKLAGKILEFYQADYVTFYLPKFPDSFNSLSLLNFPKENPHLTDPMQVCNQITDSAIRSNIKLANTNFKALPCIEPSNNQIEPTYILAPITIDNAGYGFISVCTDRTETQWGEEEVSLLRLVAGFITNLVSRIEKQITSLNTERQYRVLFESAGDAIIVFEPETEQILEANQKALNLYGFSYEEFIGMSLRAISENIPRGQQQIELTLTDGEYHNFESIQFKKNGTPMHLLINAAVIDFRGQRAIISINRDVTEIKKAEHALRINEERLRLVLESTRDGIWDWRVDHSITYFSPSYYTMLGYEPNEFAPGYEVWRNLVHPDDVEQADNVRFEQPNTDYYKTQFRMRHKNGNWIWILNRAKVIERLADGSPARIIGNHTDITMTKNYEAQLEQARVLIEQIINAIPSAIITIDQHLYIRYSNSAAQVLFGNSDNNTFFLFERYPRLYQLSDMLEKAMASSEKLQDVIPFKENSFDLRYLDVSMIPVIGVDRIQVLVITDITERRKMEALLVQSEKMHSISSLAAGMAHELNNPLGTISQGSQNLLRRLDVNFPKNVETAQSLGLNLAPYNTYLQTRQVFDIINSIKTAAGRASDIIYNMLKFSKRNDAVKNPVHIGKVINVALDIANSDYDLSKKLDILSIRIEKDIPDNLPPVSVVISEIEQVLFNLIRNSMQSFKSKKFNEGKSATIWLRAINEKEYLKIEVEDNGCGIPGSILSRVFEPFFTTKEPGDGTGLGLSVCYTIIHSNHNGQIFVESVEGSGTKFIIRLPYL